MYQKKFKRSMISVALASALQAIAGGAYAEDLVPATEEAAATDAQSAKKKDENQDAEIVTVTGMRASIERSIDTKRHSDLIVESVSAESIGKLPDVSIAEAIARLPGLTAQRVAGRASTIQIRGLADDFGAALLNGREQVSVGNNRGVEFDQYPSELLSGVVVYKTPDASLVGQGLSGTVDLQTIRPLSVGDRVVSTGLRLEKNSNGELNKGYDDQGKRFNISYIDQFFDRKLGIALGFTHLDTPGQQNRWEAWGYLDYVNVDNQGGNDFLLGGSKSQVASVSNKRDGFMAVVEFVPNDHYKTSLDIYYSKFEIDETLRFMETGLGWSGATLSNAVVENGGVISGRFTGVRPVLRNDLNTWDDKLQSIGWKNEFTINDNWSAVVDLSKSEAERDTMILETYSGLGHNSDPNATDVVDFVLDPSTGLPTFTYGRAGDYIDPQAIVLTDPGGWGQAGYIKEPGVDDKISAVRADFKRTFDDGAIDSIEFGVNKTDREKSRSGGYEAFLRLPAGQTTAAIPAGAITGIADLGYTGVPGIVGYDTDDVMGLYVQTPNVHNDIFNKSWTVEENVTTLYTQMNLFAEMGSVALRGNIGVQHVKTDQSSDGVVINTRPAVAVSDSASYSHTLPSLNLSLELPADQIVRLAMAKQISRARMDDLRANSDVSIDTTQHVWRGSGGNTHLKPWEANSLDVTYEKYFGEKAYIALAYFKKDLKTYIYRDDIEWDFSSYDPTTIPGYDPLNPPTSDISTFSAPTNGSGGELSGLEASLSIPFNLFASALDGFGLQASYSDTESEIDSDGPGGQDDKPIPGLSRFVHNVTFYYENYGFQARISQRHRSAFLGEVMGFGGDRYDAYIREEDIVDAQIGYSFADGSALEGLSVLLQVNNMSDEPYREYNPTTNLPLKYNKYGKTTMLGVNYKF